MSAAEQAWPNSRGGRTFRMAMIPDRAGDACDDTAPSPLALEYAIKSSRYKEKMKWRTA
jgi:hypothetical protein